MKQANKWGLILLMMILGVLIISCVPTEKSSVETNENNIINDYTNDQIIENDQANIPEKVAEPESLPALVVVPEPTYDPELVGLMDKSKDKNNYKYVYKLSKRNYGGNYIPETSYTVLVKDNLIKKVYTEPQKTADGRYYSEVYLDTEAKTAVIVCTLKSGSCDNDRGKKYDVRYESEKLKFTPKDLVEDMPATAIYFGDEIFDGRSLKRFDLPKDKGYKISISIDKYSGLAIKRTVYDFKDDEEMILEKHTFTDLELNNVKKAEVSLG